MTSFDGVGPDSFKRLRSIQRQLKMAKTDEERAEAQSKLAAIDIKTAWQEEVDREPKSITGIATGIRGQSKKR